MALPEGYYYDPRTGDILRVICPQAETPPASDDETWEALSGLVLMADDVTLPFDQVENSVRRRFGSDASLSGRVLQRQTARQPDGTMVTEESKIQREKS